jgi:hypothetical protein
MAPPTQNVVALQKRRATKGEKTPSSGGNVYFANGQTDRTLVPYLTDTHLFDCNDLSCVFMLHLDYVAARPVPEVAEQFEVVDGRLDPDAI